MSAPSLQDLVCAASGAIARVRRGEPMEVRPSDDSRRARVISVSSTCPVCGQSISLHLGPARSVEPRAASATRFALMLLAAFVLTGCAGMPYRVSAVSMSATVTDTSKSGTAMIYLSPREGLAK
jgi:hypothetical protein